MGTGIGGMEGGASCAVTRAVMKGDPIAVPADALLDPPEAMAVGEEPGRGRWLCQLHAGLSRHSLHTHWSSGQSGTLVSG